MQYRTGKHRAFYRERSGNPFRATLSLLVALFFTVGVCPLHALASPPSGDSPAGFWYGTDSGGPVVSGSSVPYKEPTVGGNYGGYMGKIGSYRTVLGCSETDYFVEKNADAADANWASGYGIGGGKFWLLGGPGRDPNYDGTTTEAYAWGKRQAVKAVSLALNQPLGSGQSILWMDVEQGQGWNHVYSPACSNTVKKTGIDTSLDRATFNGFWDYANTHCFYPGVYSARNFWEPSFGTGSDGTITGTYEWTYHLSSTSITPGPSGWCQGSLCAEFFGGQTPSSSHALAWQWYQGLEDYDQIDANRNPGALC